MSHCGDLCLSEHKRRTTLTSSAEEPLGVPPGDALRLSLAMKRCGSLIHDSRFHIGKCAHESAPVIRLIAREEMDGETNSVKKMVEMSEYGKNIQETLIILPMLGFLGYF